MARRRLLLLLKPFDVFPVQRPNTSNRIANPMVMDNFLVHQPCLSYAKQATPNLERHCRSCIRCASLLSKTSQEMNYLDNRRKVHKEAIKFCQDILGKRHVDWQPLLRRDLSQPIHDVDLVVTIGGDGTLLQASQFMDDSIPILGVNSDPTQAEEVEKFSEEFDARRSTGYLCAATVRNFEQMVDNILEGHTVPYKLSRMSIRVNSKLLPMYSLNDVLIAHPCPATVSRFSFRIRKNGQLCSPLVHCRSSGLRVSTAAGSTAAMLSAGGFAMPILSKDLQYLVREPISPGEANSRLMHGVVKFGESMKITWSCKEGLMYIDGSHIVHSISHRDTIQLSSNAPMLKVFLPNHLLL